MRVTFNASTTIVLKATRKSIGALISREQRADGDYVGD
jgi:hypothetical protein